MRFFMVKAFANPYGFFHLFCLRGPPLQLEALLDHLRLPFLYRSSHPSNLSPPLAVPCSPHLRGRENPPTLPPKSSYPTLAVGSYLLSL